MWEGQVCVLLNTHNSSCYIKKVKHLFFYSSSYIAKPFSVIYALGKEVLNGFFCATLKKMCTAVFTEINRSLNIPMSKRKVPLCFQALFRKNIGLICANSTFLKRATKHLSKKGAIYRNRLKTENC